jgi:hypothetical protein
MLAATLGGGERFSHICPNASSNENRSGGGCASLTLFHAMDFPRLVGSLTTFHLRPQVSSRVQIGVLSAPDPPAPATRCARTTDLRLISASWCTIGLEVCWPPEERPTHGSVEERAGRSRHDVLRVSRRVLGQPGQTKRTCRTVPDTSSPERAAHDGNLELRDAAERAAGVVDAVLNTFERLVFYKVCRRGPRTVRNVEDHSRTVASTWLGRPDSPRRSGRHGSYGTASCRSSQAKACQSRTLHSSSDTAAPS